MAFGENVVGEAEVRVDLNDRGLMSGLAAAEAKTKAAMRRIDREKATVDVRANVRRLRDDLKDVERLVKQHETNLARASSPVEKRLAAQQLSIVKARREAMQAELDASKDRLRVLEDETAELRAQEQKFAQIERLAKQRAQSDKAAATQAQKAAAAREKEEASVSKLQLAYARLAQRQHQLRQRAGRRFTAPAERTMINVELENVEDDMLRMRQRLEAIGAKPVGIQTELRGDADERARRFLANAAAISVRLGPLTMSMRQMLVLSGALAPALLSVVGAASQLIGVLGTGLVGAGVLAGSALTGLAMAGGGVFAVFKTIAPEAKKATGAVTDLFGAVLEHGRGSQQAQQAQQKLVQSLKEVGPAGREAARAVGEMGQMWREATRGADVEFKRTLVAAIQAANRLMPAFARNARQSFDLVNQGARDMMRQLSTGDMAQVWNNLHQNFNAAIKPMMAGLSNLAEYLVRVFSSASRHLQPLAQTFQNWSQGLVEGARNTGALDAKIDDLVADAKTLGNFLLAAARAARTFFAAGSDEGASWLKEMTAGLNDLTRQMQSASGQAGLKQFFADSRAMATQLFQTIVNIAELFREWAHATQPAAQAFFTLLNTVLKLVNALLDIPGIDTVLQIGMLVAFTSRMIALVGVIGRVGAALLGLRVGVGALAGVTAGSTAAGAAAGAAATRTAAMRAAWTAAGAAGAGFGARAAAAGRAAVTFGAGAGAARMGLLRFVPAVLAADRGAALVAQNLERTRKESEASGRSFIEQSHQMQDSTENASEFAEQLKTLTGGHIDLTQSSDEAQASVSRWGGEVARAAGRTLIMARAARGLGIEGMKASDTMGKLAAATAKVPKIQRILLQTNSPEVLTKLSAVGTAAMKLGQRRHVLRIMASSDNAQEMIRRLQGYIDRITKRRHTVSIGAEAKGAERTLDAVGQSVAQLGRAVAKPRVDADTRTADNKLRATAKGLQTVDRTRATPSVEVQGVDGGLLKIKSLQQAIAALRDKQITITTYYKTVGQAAKGVIPVRAQGGPAPTYAYQGGGRPGEIAAGGRYRRPTFLVGEGDPNHPEMVIATDPKYRRQNLRYWNDAGRMLGVPGFQGGGMVQAEDGSWVPRSFYRSSGGGNRKQEQRERRREQRERKQEKREQKRERREEKRERKLRQNRRTSKRELRGGRYTGISPLEELQMGLESRTARAGRTQRAFDIRMIGRDLSDPFEVGGRQAQARMLERLAQQQGNIAMTQLAIRNKYLATTDKLQRKERNLTKQMGRSTGKEHDRLKQRRESVRQKIEESITGGRQAQQALREAKLDQRETFARQRELRNANQDPFSLGMARTSAQYALAELSGNTGAMESILRDQKGILQRRLTATQALLRDADPSNDLAAYNLIADYAAQLKQINDQLGNIAPAGEALAEMWNTLNRARYEAITTFGSNVGGGPRGTVYVDQHYAAPPPDPHTWSMNMMWDLEAALA